VPAPDRSSWRELEVRIRVQVVASLAALADAEKGIHRDLVQRLEHGVSDLLEALGLPGHPAVEVDALDVGELLPHDRSFRLTVNHQPCRYSDELLQDVDSYTRVRPLAPEATPAAVLAWLAPLAEARDRQAVEFLAHAALDAIAVRSRLLLNARGAHAYLDALQSFEWRNPDGTMANVSLDVDQLLPILHAVLDQRISIADRATVGRVLRDNVASSGGATAAAEDLIAALVPKSVEIQMPSADLRAFTIAWERDGAEKFRFLRDGLFSELGLTYPDFVFAVNDELKPGSVRFTINHVPTVPVMMLGREQAIVDESGELPDGMSGKRTVNPATRRPQWLVDANDAASRAAAGQTTWDQLECLVLCLADALRVHAGCFVNRRTVEECLNPLSTVYSALVDAAKARLSIHDMTSLIRRLIAEQIPLKNVRAILEAFVDLAPSNDDRLASLRHALRRQVSAKHSRGTSVVVVYLLEEKLEAVIRLAMAADRADSAGRLAEATAAEMVVAAIRAELVNLRRTAPTASVPSLLTPPDIRRALRDLIAPELPSIQVIAHGEIPPMLNVQPVARIASVA
jgi:FHIPEP family protein